MPTYSRSLSSRLPHVGTTIFTVMSALAQQHGLAFEPIAIDLSALKLAAGNNGPSTRQQPLKSRYSAIDQQRWSKRYGIPIKRPEVNNPQRANVAFCGVEPAAAEISMLPQNYLKLEGKAAQQMVKLMDVLDDHDDVRQVWSNFDIEEKDIEASLA